MSNWKKYKLGDLVTMNYGKSLIAEKRLNGNIPVYSSAGICGWHNKNLEDSNAIIVGRKGNVGSVFYSQIPFYCIDTAYYILPDKSYDLKFLYYKLLSLNLIKLTSDSAVPGLNRETAYAQEITIPETIEEQSQIAQILTSFDDKIELLGQKNQTLEAIAQTIFKEWFVDFNFPGFDRELVDGLPKGWRKGKVSDIYKTTSGGTPSRTKNEYYSNGTVNWVKSKELNGKFIFDTEEKITEDAVKNSSAKPLPRHSVLLAMYGATVGEYAIAGKETTCNQAICAIIDNEFPYTYFFEFFKMNKKNIVGSASGSAQQNISQALIQQLEILIPPIEIVREYHKAVQNFFNKMEINILQIQTLTQFRDSLLPKLMSGEITT